MTEAKKKKKQEKPQFLFAWNKNFVTGFIDTPGNKEQIAAAIATRHHISSYSNIFSEKHNSGLGCGIGAAIFFILFYLFCLFAAVILLWAIIYTIITQQTITFGTLIMSIVGILVTGGMGIFGIWSIKTELNYRPKKLQYLYKKLIKDGKIVVGEFTGEGSTYAHRHDPSYIMIQYRFEVEKGKTINGEIPYQFPGLRDHLVPGMPIYVVYVNEKLHAPL